MSKPIIHFVLEDMDVEAPVGASFQEIVQASEADVTFGCRNGTCGTCRIRVEKGMENISSLEREEKDFLESIESPSNERLGCQIRINGNCSISYIGL
ncbi:2Fe-2S iron-sulfur cluster binding domain-containing protein [Silvanigrella paludirubra]|uniref:2Fe-2S iron-sulfur cluster binding domain-containing protein n=1 Tax=Silvanigrella paludirubra TaxID=2499159 RepID=A0A6N6VNF7_9BACT|nr:2Fe-2S iron-sulfur cluster-binding protein [Silvanigrella paludirubra]KAB8036514.1 2Fe-2S iron-sulfur cluster binding domain-containing protein [Silvanigrella paludirubra]